MRKARILGRRKAFLICQKFFYLLWCSVPHGQAFHIKLGSPLSTFDLAPLLLMPMERQNTWVTYSKGTCTQSGGLQPRMTPQPSAGRAVPTAALESISILANEAGRLQALSLDTGMKTKLCFNWWFHLPWTVFLHFCKGQAVSCRMFCHCRVLRFLKRCKHRAQGWIFSPLHHMRRCKWANSPCTLTQYIGAA